MKRSLRMACWGAAFALLASGCSEDTPVGTEAPSPEEGASVDELGAGSAAMGGMPFSKLSIFLEKNDTDNDLGVQVHLDAPDWEWVRAYDPRGKVVLEIEPERELKKLGITELRFESAEPSPAKVLGLIPPGDYRFVGETTEGERLWGKATLSHALPPAPNMSPEDGDVTDPENTEISWDPIPGLAGYEVIVANQQTGASLEVRLDAGATSFLVPPEFMGPNGEYKAEVLSIAMNGNKVISEATFFTGP